MAALTTELAPGAIFYRRLPSGRQTLRRVIYVAPEDHGGSVLYALPDGRRRECKAVTFLRWAGIHYRITPQPGPLL